MHRVLREHRRGTLTQIDKSEKELFKKKMTCDLSLRKKVVGQMEKAQESILGRGNSVQKQLKETITCLF